MTDLKQTVTLTSSTVENMSRHDMLDWVNTTVHGQYKKIEELCSGIAYCQLMELLFPNCIGIKKVKMNAKMEHEFLHNLKLFQAAFTKLQLDKSVPIDRLIKKRFQDNFEFLQWFKKFFDTHSAGKENLKVPAALAAAAANAPKPIRKPVLAVAATVLSTKLKTTPPASQSALQTPRNVAHTQEERQISPNSVRVLKEQLDGLTEQIANVETERNFYYKKLTAIEALLNEAVEKNEKVDWSKRALKLLYQNEDSEEF